MNPDDYSSGCSRNIVQPLLPLALLTLCVMLASCGEVASTADRTPPRSADGKALYPDSVPVEAHEAARNSYFFTDQRVPGSCPRSISPSSFSVAYKVDERWVARGPDEFTVSVALWVLGDVALLDTPSLANHSISERMAVDTLSLALSKNASGGWTATCDSMRVYLPPSDAGDPSMYVNPDERERLLAKAGVENRR